MSEGGEGGREEDKGGTQCEEGALVLDFPYKSFELGGIEEGELKVLVLIGSKVLLHLQIRRS